MRPPSPRRHSAHSRCVPGIALIGILTWLLVLVLPPDAGAASTGGVACEGFGTDPVRDGRFTSQVADTESAFDWLPDRGALRFRSDVDASAAWYHAATQLAPITAAQDASFSVRFRVEGFDDQESPKATLGLLTSSHVGAGGAGLTLLVSVVDGRLRANALVALSPTGDQAGPQIGLSPERDYLAVGRYRARERRFTVEILDGAGFTNLVGYSSVAVPTDRSFLVDRLGLQNDGARRNFDPASGSITLLVDDLCTPAELPHRLSLSPPSLRLTEGTLGGARGTLTVTLTPASSEPVSVVCETISGTARASRDFQGFLTNLVFGPGQRDISIPVEILGDRVDEWDEAFEVVLRDGEGAVVAADSRTEVVILDDDAPPRVSIRDAAALEGDTGTKPMTFELTIEGASEKQPLEIGYQTRDGSARAPGDYFRVTNTIELPFELMTTNEFLQRVVTVDVIGDTLVEREGANLFEQFTVDLSSGPDLQLIRRTGVGTIDDDDGDRVFSISGPAPSLEGPRGSNHLVYFVVNASRPAGVLPVEVHVVASSGTATVNQDLSPLSRTIEFPEGASSVAVPVEIRGDDLPEADETFSLQLSDPEGGTIHPVLGRAEGTILNDDPFPTVRVEDVTILEGDAGSTQATVLVSLSEPALVPVLFSYVTRAGTGTATANADYRPVEVAITNVFAVGQANSQVPVTILGDRLDEDDESFELEFRVLLAGVVKVQTSRVIIQDDDPGPEVTIRDVEVREGDSGTTNAVFLVSLSTPSGREVKVGHVLENGSAILNEDYLLTHTPMPLSIPAGATTAEIQVPVAGDRVREGDEDFFVQLGVVDPDRMRLAAASRARGLIVNDDMLRPVLTLVAPPPVREGAEGSSTNAVFVVRLDRPSSVPVAFTFNTADGTAVGGPNRLAEVDYRAVVGREVRTIPVGQTSTHFPVEIFGDRVDEQERENFFGVVDLITTNDVVAGSLRAEGVIVDDDVSVVSIADASVVEGDLGSRTARFPLTLSHPVDRDVRVRGRTADGTARVSDGDYRPADREVVIPAGASSATFDVEIEGDIRCEADETFEVRLSDPVGVTLGDSIGTGEIRDDDTTRVSVTSSPVLEGDEGTTTNLVFSLTFVPVPKAALTLRYRLESSDGSVPGTLEIPPGTVYTNIAVGVRGDNRAEEDEAVTLVLDPVECAVINPSTTIGTILDDDPILQVIRSLVVEEQCVPSNDAIDPGEWVKMSFAFSNPSGFPATNVAVCLLASPNTTLDGLACTNVGNLAPGETRSRSFSFRVDGACGDEVELMFQISEGGFEFGLIPYRFRLGVRSDGTEVCCAPIDIAVSATGFPSQVVVSNLLTYQVVVTNRAPNRVGGVLLTNRFDENLVVTRVAPSRGSCSGSDRTWICDLGTMEPGESIALEALVIPRVPATVTSLFAAGGTGSDQTPNNNFAIVFTTVVPIEGLSVYPVTVREGTGRNTNAVFKVWLWPERGAIVDLEAFTTDLTARAGSDYVATTNTLRFNRGETEKTVSVAVIGDSLAEGDETFSLGLRNAVGESRLGPRALGTILDDDAPRLTIGDVVASEASGFAEFLIQASGLVRDNITFQYGTVAGTARAGLDFTAVDGATNIPAGVDRVSIRVPLLDDVEFEGGEQFQLEITRVTGAGVDRGLATGHITDDELEPILVTVTNAIVLEGARGQTNYLLFPVHLSRAMAGAARVQYSTRDGTALAGEDYLPVTNGMVAFDSGGRGFASVAVLGDDLREFNETLQVVLSNPVGVVLGAEGRVATGTVANDEYLPDLHAGTALLIEENCPPANGAIDPMETVKVRFTMINRGLAATTNLQATLQSESPGAFRVISASALTVSREIAPGTNGSVLMEFQVDGVCGTEWVPVLRLTDNGVPAGEIRFSLGFTLGVVRDGVPSCCSRADLAVLGPPLSDWLIDQPVTNVLAVSNRGPSEAMDVRLLARLGPGVEVAANAPIPRACILTGDLLSCELRRIPPEGVIDLKLVLIARALGPVDALSAVISTSSADPVGTNDFFVLRANVLPPIGIRIDHATVSETSDPVEAVFHIEANPAPKPGETIVVDYATREGTARADADFVPIQGRATLTSTSPVFTVRVPVLDDTEDELAETFYVDLMDASGAVLSPRSTGIGTILDNDEPCLVIDDVSVDVGFKGAVVARIPIRLSSASVRPASVSYRTRNGSAGTGDDYESVASRLDLPPGTLATNILVTVNGNTVDEGVEQFYLDLGEPEGIRICDPVAVVTITDRLPAELILHDAEVVESDTGTNLVFELELVRTGGMPGSTASIAYRTFPGSALPGEDFVPSTNVVIFPPGVTRTNFLVPVIGDHVWEPREDITVWFENPQNLTVTNTVASVKGRILDDDPIPRISVVGAPIPEGSSGQTRALFRVLLSNPSSEAITVSVGTFAGTAKTADPKADLTPLTTSLLFRPRETTREYEVSVVADSRDEFDETFIIDATVVGTNAKPPLVRYTATILDDDDAPTLSVWAPPGIREGDSGTTPAAFQFLLSAPSGKPLRWTYQTVDDPDNSISATAGADYDEAAGSVSLEADQEQTRFEVAVSVRGDLVKEPDEAFRLSVVAMENLGDAPREARATILDDDGASSNRRPTVAWLAPDDGAVFPLCRGFDLVAHATDPDGTVDRVEFFRVLPGGGAEWLGELRTAPFQFPLTGFCEEGEYVFRARAVDPQGLDGFSTDLHVRVFGGHILVIQRDGDCDPDQTLTYLDPVRNPSEEPYEILDLEEFRWLQPVVRTLEAGRMTEDLLAGFRVVVWQAPRGPDDRGRSWDAEIDALWGAWKRGVGIYIVGDRLADIGASLSPRALQRWTELAGVVGNPRVIGPGIVTRVEPVARQYELLSGRWGLVEAFSYPGTIKPGVRVGAGEARLLLGDVPVLVRIPPFGAYENPFQGRRLVQSFRITDCERDKPWDEGSLTSRRILLRNGVRWLMGGECDNFSITLDADFDATGFRDSRFPLEAKLSNNGACNAGNVIVVQEVSPGLRISHAEVLSATGAPIPADIRWDTRSVTFGIGTIPGAEPVFLRAWVEAEAAGRYENRYRLGANFRGESVEVRGVSIIGDCVFPTLEVAQEHLAVRGDCPVWVQLEESVDLIHWEPMMEIPPLEELLILPLRVSGNSAPRFYRLIQTFEE